LSYLELIRVLVSKKGTKQGTSLQKMVFFDVIIWELFGKLENLSIFNSRLISFYEFIFIA